MDLLSSFYLCLRSQNYIMVYTFNPFTNYAPHPWKEVEVTNKPDPRWTSYNLRLTQDNDMCRLLQFDKSKLLNGYPVRISAYANISFQLHSTILRFTIPKINDYTWTPNALKRIDNNIENAIPSYDELRFAIATKSRYIISTFIEIDSVIDPYTSIFAISILLLIITLIALVNEYQFLAAIVDVYRHGSTFTYSKISYAHYLYLSVYIFGFVFSPVLQGQVFALLTKPSYRNIETLQDLYDYNYHVYYDTNIHDNIMDAGLWTTDDDQKYLHRIDDPFSLECFELARHHSSVACISLSY
ncbi:Protein of unknown function, partial [Cotesia congregata]